MLEQLDKFVYNCINMFIKILINVYSWFADHLVYRAGLFEPFMSL